ncbi:hypothetical protein [Dongia sp. agr-C8]
MAKPIPVERDPVLGLWARLALVEQCSLAILHYTFPSCRPVRPTLRGQQPASTRLDQDAPEAARGPADAAR